MADKEQFDPYRKWLGIRDPQRPPTHYRLLGIEPFEDDPEVIQNAADQRMAHVRTFQTGAHSERSQQILNELSMARICLLKPEKKSAYDAQLRADGPKPAKRASKPAPVAAPEPEPEPVIDIGEDPYADEVITDEIPNFAADAEEYGGGTSGLRSRPPVRSGNPPWLIPATIGGGVAAILILFLIVWSMLGDGEESVASNENPSPGTVAASNNPVWPPQSSNPNWTPEEEWPTDTASFQQRRPNMPDDNPQGLDFPEFNLSSNPRQPHR